MRNVERDKARSRAYYLAHKEAILARARARDKAQRAADPEGYRRLRALRQTRCRARNPDQVWRSDLARHGWTPELFEEAWVKQGGNCAICGWQMIRAKPKTTNNPAADHCHTTGRPRELLHFRCNMALGLFREDPAILRAAADYLDKHNNQQNDGDKNR